MRFVGENENKHTTGPSLSPSLSMMIFDALVFLSVTRTCSLFVSFFSSLVA